MTIRYFKVGTKVRFSETTTFEGSRFCECYKKFEDHQFIVDHILEFEDIKLKEYVYIICLDDPSIVIKDYIHVAHLVKLDN
jgi:hypothetical protein